MKTLRRRKEVDQRVGAVLERARRANGSLPRDLVDEIEQLGWEAATTRLYTPPEEFTALVRAVGERLRGVG